MSTSATPARTPKPRPAEVYDRLLEMIFDGRFAPGAKLIEESLAAELGVSRVPVRETLAKLVGQGVLIGGGRGQGVRMRDYSIEDVRQLYEYREVLEGVAAAAAARMATTTDIARLEIIRDQAEGDLARGDWTRWGDLDHHFHVALAEASHNQRVSQQLKLLVSECRYLFFICPHPSRVAELKTSEQRTEAYMQRIQREHVDLLALIKAGEADQAEHKAREDMRRAAERLSRWLITGDLAVGRASASSDS
jgi:DNA-binding GntR family transcriptional regulator